MPEPVFEVYKDHVGKFRWRLRTANEQEIASSQGYESKEGCLKGIESVKHNAAKADRRRGQLASMKKPTRFSLPFF